MGNIHSCFHQLLEVFEVRIKIYYSRRHWTLLGNSASNPSPDEAKVADNVEVFKTLQSHPTWGFFFHKFDKEELVVGRKFAEGAQAELYEAQVKMDDTVWRQEVLKYPDRKYVLKVFKLEQLLRKLQRLWPEGYLRFQAQRLTEQHSRRYNCDVICGTLLEDARFKGRFAFLLQREEEDLRDLIDRNMSWTIWSPWTIFRRSQPLRPFPKEVAESIMYEIACGVDWLHRHGIVHRDLKSSNVLVSKGNMDKKMYCFVADYECSVGCVGTGLFRAPEIFRPHSGNIFTKAVDVYGYGMICFEILTGKLPFADHSFADAKHLVLSGHCLELPTDIEKWTCELLMRCWHSDPEMRPSFGEILKIISANSTSIRGNRTMNKEFVGVKPKPEWSQLITLRLSMFIELEEYLSCTSDSLTIDTWAFWSCTSDILTLRMEVQATEMSKSHWSEPATLSYEDDINQITAENLQLFQELRMHPIWGSFFWTFGDGVDDSGDLVTGEKIGEGGQAEIFYASVTWNDQVHSEDMLRILRLSDYVLKVFNRGSSLQNLCLQMPHGMLTFFGERAMSAQKYIGERAMSPQKYIGERAMSGSIFEWKKPRNTRDVICGTLLKDGRYAYLLEREPIDLRSLIEKAMMTSEDQLCGPFAKAVAERMIYDIALGMDWLHSHDIVHRDFKAANILVRGSEDDNYECFVADYENSMGVIGTGYFRAPEILQACMDGNVLQHRFVPANDIYSYGMLCYEILTGKLPLDDHPLKRERRLLIDSIIRHDLRPEIPAFVDDWVRELLKWCWQSDPVRRPSVGEILNLFERNMS